MAGYIALSFFLCPQLYFPVEYVREVESWRTPGSDPHTRRIITTSVKDDHLRVLWGEIGRFYTSAKWPLGYMDGGPLLMNHHEIRFASEKEEKNPINYLLGQVSLKGEGMAGHHAAYTLLCIDEASGVADEVYTQGATWAKRMLIFGNCNDCQTFFKKMVNGGDIAAK